MSRKDYERLCSELDNTRQKDHPHAYEALSQEEREALQYWIERAIQPALKADEGHSSYGLKHEYERETKLRSEEHTSELQSHSDLVCRLLLEKKKISIGILR